MKSAIALFSLVSSVAVADPAVGDKMPALDAAGALERLQGTAPALEGNVVVLSFFALWCPGCVNELPFLVGLDADLRARGLTVVSVSIDRPEARADLVRMLAAKKAKHAVLLDPDERLKRVWQGRRTSMPYLVVVDRAGVVRHIEEGFDPKATPRLRKLLDGLLAAPRGT